MCEPVEILVVVALFHMGGCLLHEMGLRLFARSFISPRQTNSMGVPFPLTVSPLTVSQLDSSFRDSSDANGQKIYMLHLRQWRGGELPPAANCLWATLRVGSFSSLPNLTEEDPLLPLPPASAPALPAPTFCQFGHQNTIAVFCLGRGRPSWA